MSARTETRVRYPETDRMGVAWHGHFLAWFELGRTEWMREIGLPYGELEDLHGVLFPVIEAGARYVAPARYDEVLDIDTRLTAFTAARVRFAYRVFRRSDGALLAEGFTEHAAVDRAGRPRRLPGDIRSRIRERASREEAGRS